MNVAHTDDTQLNVFADFEPKLSDASRGSELLFLGNIQPDLQRRVRAEATRRRFAALDSMNLWIDTARDSLVAAIAEVDCLLLNDAEIRMLTGEPNLIRAAAAVHGDGPARSSSPSAASTAPSSSPPRAPSRSPPCCSRRSATRPAPATASPAASSATSTALDDARPLAGRAPPGDGLRLDDGLLQRRGLRHRARPRLERPEIDARLSEFKALTHFEVR